MHVSTFRFSTIDAVDDPIFSWRKQFFPAVMGLLVTWSPTANIGDGVEKYLLELYGALLTPFSFLFTSFASTCFLLSSFFFLFFALTSATLWASSLLKSRTACFDMKDDRSKRSGLMCVRWSALLEVTSDLGANSHSKLKSFTWLTSSHEGDESTDLFRDMDLSEQRRTGTRIFASYQEGEDWWQ